MKDEDKVKEGKVDVMEVEKAEEEEERGEEKKEGGEELKVEE